MRNPEEDNPIKKLDMTHYETLQRVGRELLIT
jgi:hypothetical protein